MTPKSQIKRNSAFKQNGKNRRVRTGKGGSQPDQTAGRLIDDTARG